MKNKVIWIEPISQNNQGITWRWACSCGATNIENLVPSRGNTPDKVIPSIMFCKKCDQKYCSDPEAGQVNFSVDALIE